MSQLWTPVCRTVDGSGAVFAANFVPRQIAWDWRVNADEPLDLLREARRIGRFIVVALAQSWSLARQNKHSPEVL
jgi:hypothetical protein